MTPKQQPGNSKQDYSTPKVFITAVKQRLGIDEFFFDFAADATNTKALLWWGVEEDSLAQSPECWAEFCEGGWGWLNPPFTNIGPWAKRCVETAELGGSIALLVPASVGANWYRDYVHPDALVLALNGRLVFMPDKPTWLYPKDCILCLFGPKIVKGFDVWTWKEQQ